MTKSLSGKKKILDQGSKMISTKKDLMKTGIIIRSKGIFVLNYSVKPKKNVLVILVSKVFLTAKNSGKP